MCPQCVIIPTFTVIFGPLALVIGTLLVFAVARRKEAVARYLKESAKAALVLYAVLAVGWSTIGGFVYYPPNETPIFRAHMAERVHYWLPSPSVSGLYWVPPVFEHGKIAFRYDVPNFNMYEQIATLADERYKAAPRLQLQKGQLRLMVNLAQEYLNKHYPETLLRECKIGDIEVYEPEKGDPGTRSTELAYYMLSDRSIHINAQLALRSKDPIWGTLVHEVGHDGLAPGNEPYNQLLALETLAEMMDDDVPGTEAAFWYELRAHARSAMGFLSQWYWGVTLFSVESCLGAGADAFYSTRGTDDEYTEPLYLGYSSWAAPAGRLQVIDLPQSLYCALRYGAIFTKESQQLGQHPAWQLLVWSMDTKLKLGAQGVRIRPFDLTEKVLGYKAAIWLAKKRLFSVRDEWVLVRGQRDDFQRWINKYYTMDERRQRAEWAVWKTKHVVQRQASSILYWYGPLEAMLHSVGMDRPARSLLFDYTTWFKTQGKAKTTGELTNIYLDYIKYSELPLNTAGRFVKGYLNIREGADWPYKDPAYLDHDCPVKGCETPGVGGVLFQDFSIPEDVLVPAGWRAAHEQITSAILGSRQEGY